jgi:hypothetical protein
MNAAKKYFYTQQRGILLQLGVSVELSKKLKWNDAVTTKAVREIGMNFGNTPIEFKESISSSFSMQFKIKNCSCYEHQPSTIFKEYLNNEFLIRIPIGVRVYVNQ